jgi:cytidine deaminase
MSGVLSMTQFLQENPEVLDPRRAIDEEEHFRRWIAARETLVWRAYHARERAISYRNFKVGCAVYAWRPYREAKEPWQVDEDRVNYMAVRWTTFTGANLKTAENIRPVCAEQIAVSAARMAGYTRILGIVVVGEPQADHESGLTHKSLHPCGVCRRTLAALPEVHDDTQIIAGGIVGEKIHLEEFSFAELVRLHKAH